METNDRRLLARQLAEGRVVLFTGAGFSLDAKSKAGTSVPSVTQLRRLLWNIAFPSDPIDESSSLGDIFEVASKRSGNTVRSILNSHLSVEHTSLTGEYRLWFSFPWHRHYTLNVDDLDEQAARAFSLPRRVRSLSALRDSFVAAGSELLSIHLNGRARDYPDVTFSAREYGQRAAQPDEWYQALSADLLSHPVVFVGSTLDEPALWQHVEMRRGRHRGARELRPASFLVSPDLSAARVAMLRDYNVTWVKATAREFANEVLSEMQVQAEQGQAAIERQFAPTATAEILVSVAHLRSAAPPADGPAYLLGRQATCWDITDGYAVVRDFEEPLAEKCFGPDPPKFVLVLGTAGSGKTTTLLRLALRADSAGRTVHVLSQDAAYGPSALRDALKMMSPQVIVVDDLYSVGRQTADLLADWLEGHQERQLLAATRGTNIQALEPGGALGGMSRYEHPVPHLADSDISLLLEALTRAKRLGVLAGKTRQQQVKSFRDRAGRQLIVALIEATSGQRFDEKLAAECDELDVDSRFLYAAACLATTRGFGILQEELLVAHGTADNRTMNQMRELVRRGLIIQGPQRRLSARHRLVADKAVEHFRDTKQLAEPLRGLLFAVASKTDPQLSRRALEWRLLISLINHDYLQRLLLDIGEVRRCYSEVEDLLAWDYHFWLQRGSLEVKTGDMESAFNFLSQAKGLAPDDYKVQTEWAYFTLKSASNDAMRADSLGRAESALVELEDVIQRRGETDSYPYHVYGSQGLRWARRAPIGKEDRARLLDRLRRLVGEGVRHHARQADLKQLHEDLQKEYLSLATRS